MIRYVFIVSLALLVSVGTMSAATITVGASGADYTTITAAINAAVSGDTVLVLQGIYQEQVVMKVEVNLISASQNDTEYNPFYNRSIETVIEGTADPVVILANNTRLEGFTITGGSSGYTVFGYYADAEVVGNRIIQNGGGGLYFLGDGRIDKNLIAGNGGSGLEIAYSPAIVHFNTIADNLGDGLRSTESSADIRGNIIARNGTASSGSAGIECVGSITPNLDYNDVWNNLDSNYVGCTAGTNSISQDPIWTADYSYYYWIDDNSPCADATLDFGDGYSYFNSVPDMGWYEYYPRPIPSLNIYGILAILLFLGFFIKQGVERSGYRMKVMILICVISTLVLGTRLISAKEPVMDAIGRSDNFDSVQPLTYPNGIQARHVAKTDCGIMLIDFEGIDNHLPVGTISGDVDVIFGSTWLANIDGDEGPYYSGNFANEPSPSTVAFGLYEQEHLPINFSEGVGEVSFYYSTSLDAYPLYVEAYDDVNGQGNLVASAVGTVLGHSGQGASCSGDPTGQFCLWDQLTLESSTLNIRSIMFPDAPGSWFIIDNMEVLTSPVITGTVYRTEHPDEIPVENQEVVVRNSSQSIQFSVFTDEDGVYTTDDNPTPLPLSDSYDVEVTIDGCAQATETVYISTPDIYTQDIVADCVIIDGVLFQSDFQNQEFVPAGAGEIITINKDGGTVYTLTTDSSGYFSTESISAPLTYGTYYVIAEIDGCLETIQTVEVLESRTYTVNLYSICQAIITGKVYSEDGPVNAAEVSLYLYGGGTPEQTRFTTTEGDYQFIIDPLPSPLPYTFELDAVKDAVMASPEPAYVTISAESLVGVANFCCFGCSQRNNPGDDYVYYPSHFSTPGFDANHVNLAGMPEESIDTFTGKVNLTYTDLHIPGKCGLDLNIQRTYSSCIKERTPWASDNIFMQKFVAQTALGLGWDIHFGRLLNRSSDSPVIVMPDGSRHVAYTVPASGGNGYPKYTEDLWRLDMIDDGDSPDFQLTLTNGIKYYFDSNNYYEESNLAECSSKECVAASEIRSADATDLTGNRITITYTTNAAGRYVIDYVTDTYGRSVDFEYDTDPAHGFLTQVKGPNDSVYLQYSVDILDNAKYSLQTFTARANGRVGDPGDMVTTYSYNTDPHSPTFGVLTDISLPSGGTITYEHAEHDFYLQAFDVSNVYDRTYVDIALVSRTADGPDVVTGTTNYDIATYGPADQYTVVTDPLGYATQYRYWNYYSTDLGDIAEWKVGLPAEVINFDGTTGDNAVKTQTWSYESRRLSEDRVLNADRDFVNIPVTVETQTTLHGSAKSSYLLKSNQERVSGKISSSQGSETLMSNRANAISRVVYGYHGSDGDTVDLSAYQNLGMPWTITEYDYSASAYRTNRFTYSWEDSCTGYANFRSANFISGIYLSELLDGGTGGSLVTSTESNYYSNPANPDFTRLSSETKLINPGSVTTSYNYDADGNLYQITDPLTKVTTFLWNNGSISQISTPQQDIIFTQDIDQYTGRVIGTTGPNGINTKTIYAYDDLGRITQISPPADQTTIITYNVSGNQVTSQQGSYTVVHDYDSLGRLKLTSVPNDQNPLSYVNKGYDAVGNLNFVSEASASQTETSGTTTTYGALNRVTDISDPDGTTEYVYDGNSVSVIRQPGEPNEQQTDNVYDAFGRLDHVNDANGKIFDYGYDVLDNMILVEHPNGVNCSDRTFTYDGLGRLMSENHPETGTTSYTYYDSGQVATITRASGKVEIYEYDNIYRITSKSVGSGGDQIEVDFFYDGQSAGHGYTYDQNPLNHRTGAVVYSGDPLVEESALIWRTFDNQERNTEKIIDLSSPSMNNVYTFGYDTMGNLTSVTYPSGVNLGYNYGASNNLLESVMVSGSSLTDFILIDSIDHNPAGRLHTFTYGNGSVTTIHTTAAERNRPLAWESTVNGFDLYDGNHVLDYDGFGNVYTIGTATFSYDNLNRLTSTSYLSGESIGYTYDSTGNILTVNKNGSDVGIYTYVDNRINDSGYFYDLDGNLTDDGYNSYSFNSLGQVLSIANTGGTINYQYNAMGKRILSSNASGDSIYSYLGEQLLSEYDGADYIDSIFFEGQLMGRIIDNGITTEVTYAHLNHLGSPIAFTDNTVAPGTSVVWPEQTGGTPFEVHQYEPFGADFNDIGTPPRENQLRYTGKLFDANTGKHYFNARYLNSITSSLNPELPPRFLSPDIMIGNPTVPQSWNRYSSCQNNPLIYTDPSGMELKGTMTFENFELMSDEERSNWIATVLSSENRAAISAAARKYNIPPNLLGLTILNELADISLGDLLQEKVPVKSGSFGIGQVGIETVVANGLIPNVNDPDKIRTLLSTNDAVSINAVAIRLNQLINVAANNPNNAWQKAFGSPSESDLRQGNISGQHIYMIVAAYNSPHIQKAVNPGNPWNIEKKTGNYLNARTHGRNAFSMYGLLKTQGGLFE